MSEDPPSTSVEPRATAGDATATSAAPAAQMSPTARESPAAASGRFAGFPQRGGYATNIPIADRLFTEHQEKLKKEAEAAKPVEPKTRKGKR